LLRRLCEACKREEAAPASLTELFYEKKPGQSFFAAVGCPACAGTGYRGLVGVFELFEPNDAVTRAIGTGVPVEEIRRIALANGWTPLVEDALRKAEKGVTSLAEIARKL